MNIWGNNLPGTGNCWRMGANVRKWLMCLKNSKVAGSEYIGEKIAKGEVIGHQGHEESHRSLC